MEDARFDLDVVRGIRDDFAHSFDLELSFSDQSVSDRCANLGAAQAFIDGYDLSANAPDQNIGAKVIYAMQAAFKPPRWRYQLAVGFLAQYPDEVPAGAPAYSGADLAEEVRALSANMRIKISAAGTVDCPPTSPSSEAV